jgi:hypothetical protein
MTVALFLALLLAALLVARRAQHKPVPVRVKTRDER